MIVSKSEKETCDFAASLKDEIQNGGVICLFGDLGSGKTAFTKGLAASLGILAIKSPTYTYIRKYELSDRDMYHIDLYRLEEIDDLMLQEIEEILKNEEDIVVIEWAQRMKNYLPKKRIDITIKYVDETTRNIQRD